MNSITQNYEYLLKKVIERIDCNRFDVFQKFKSSGDVLNYVNFSDTLQQCTKDFYKELFTINAYVEIKRRVYFNKKTKECYYFVDDFLGLPPKLRTMFVNDSNIRLNYFNSLRPNEFNSFDDIPVATINKTLISDCKICGIHSMLKDLSSFSNSIQPS